MQQFVTPHTRAATADDMPQILTLLTAHLQQFALHQLYTEDDVRHWLTPRKDVINCYVVEVFITIQTWSI